VLSNGWITGRPLVSQIVGLLAALCRDRDGMKSDTLMRSADGAQEPVHAICRTASASLARAGEGLEAPEAVDDPAEFFAMMSMAIQTSDYDAVTDGIPVIRSLLAMEGDGAWFAEALGAIVIESFARECPEVLQEHLVSCFEYVTQRTLVSQDLTSRFIAGATLILREWSASSSSPRSSAAYRI